MKQMKENNVLEATTFSNFKTMVSFHYLMQLMAREHFA
jgi:hypothetical protein